MIGKASYEFIEYLNYDEWIDIAHPWVCYHQYRISFDDLWYFLETNYCKNTPYLLETDPWDQQFRKVKRIKKEPGENL